MLFEAAHGVITSAWRPGASVGSNFMPWDRYPAWSSIAIAPEELFSSAPSGRRRNESIRYDRFASAAQAILTLLNSRSV